MADHGWSGGQGEHHQGGPPPSAPPTVPFTVPPPPAPYGYAPPGYPVYPAQYQQVPGPPVVMYQAVMPVVMGPPRSKVAAALLAFFLGVLGIHNFYLGRIALGVAQLLLATVGGFFTCGLATVVVAVWAFVEFIVILCGGINDRYGRPLV